MSLPLPLPHHAPPPPTPLYILRGHPTTIHTLTFTRNNSHLLTGDVLGYITIWSLSSRRPAGDSEAIDIMRLLDGARIWKSIKPPELAGQERTVGMDMSLAFKMIDGNMVLAAGYEGGHVVVYTRTWADSGNKPRSEWKVVYKHKGHSEPVLGLALDGFTAWTTSADSLLIRHDIAGNNKKAVNTRHHGQQGVVLRDDGKLVATAGWDGMVRVYAAKAGMKELAVLNWHTVGCYAVAFGSVAFGDSGERTLVAGGASKREEERSRKEAQRHWVAAGDKDGRVTLWEIY